MVIVWCHDTLHGNTEHNDSQSYSNEGDTLCNHNVVLCVIILTGFMLSVDMLGVVMLTVGMPNDVIWCFIML